jgi:hypothetical protein
VQPGGTSTGRTGAGLRPPQQQQLLRIEGYGPHDERGYFAFSEMATKTVHKYHFPGGGRRSVIHNLLLHFHLFFFLFKTNLFPSQITS